jgi:hypothetical protein
MRKVEKRVAFFLRWKHLHDPECFNQINCALYDDHCLWVVPGSHSRGDTAAEVRACERQNGRSLFLFRGPFACGFVPSLSWQSVAIRSAKPRTAIIYQDKLGTEKTVNSNLNKHERVRFCHQVSRFPERPVPMPALEEDEADEGQFLSDPERESLCLEYARSMPGAVNLQLKAGKIIRKRKNDLLFHWFLRIVS